MGRLVTEAVWLACPLCGHDLIAVADVPAIRQLAVRCPACIDLAVTVMLERCQPANPYNQTPEDPDGWRVQSVIAVEQDTPQCEVHRRQSRRQARRRKRRGR